MNIEQIVDCYPFIEKADQVMGQLLVYDDWVLGTLEEDNVVKILDYISKYDIDVPNFFINNLDSFTFNFEDEFKPRWYKLFSKYGENLFCLLESELILFDELENIGYM